jgi:hypothetical protein
VKAGLRLEVLPIKTSCPFGRGEQRLSDCFLNSITPGHFCCDPEKSGAARCPHVVKHAKEHGWRSHRVAPGLVPVADNGQTHQQFPLDIIYSPLDAAGTQWTAINVFSGERFEVVLYRDYPHRRSPEGGDIEQQYKKTDEEEFKRRVAKGGVVHIPYIYPIWSGITARDSWRCACEICQGGGMTMSRSRGDTTEFPGTEKPVIDPATVKSAPPIQRDPDGTPSRGSGPQRYFGSSTAKTTAPSPKPKLHSSLGKPVQSQLAAKPTSFKTKAKKKTSEPITAGDMLSTEIKKKARK